MNTRPTPRPHECARCGQAHDLCLAHNKRGGPCGRPPARGQDICGRHGADAPQAKAAADKRIQRALAQEAVATFGLPRDVVPFDAHTSDENQSP